MPWFPVDDAFHSHPKKRKAGLEAVGLWTVCGSFCMAYLTDGFVPEWFVKEQPRGMTLAKRLIEAALWRVGKCKGENGFWFHDWKSECTKEHVEGLRKKARDRQAKFRESQRESRVTNGVSHSVSHGAQTKPNQTKPNQTINPLVNSGGELTQVEPPAFCPRHPSGTKSACGACADARRGYEIWRNLQQSNELVKRRKARERLMDCRLCDEAGWILGTDPLVKCQHPEAVNG